MADRKVLNKYYPPDFDPAKIPRGGKRPDMQFTIRTMAPFNMICNVCGCYIYKGTKFNSRCEPTGDKYLTIRIMRFYIKCPRCISEIVFKTDPENDDYEMELGASRNFEAMVLAERAEKRRLEEEKEEEENDPMKMLEKRTQASQREMDMIDQLEELKEISAAKIRINESQLIAQHHEDGVELERRKLDEEKRQVEAILYEGHSLTADGQRIFRLPQSHSSSDHAAVDAADAGPAADAASDDHKTLEDRQSRPADQLNGSCRTKSDKDDVKKSTLYGGILPAGSLKRSREKIAQLVKKKPQIQEENTKKPVVVNALQLVGGYGSDSSDSDSS